MLTPHRYVRYDWILAFMLCAAAGAPLCAQTTQTAASSDNAITIIDPKPGATTTPREFANILGSVKPGSKVKVGGADAQVFATGIFVRDCMPLAMGENSIKIEVVTPDGATTGASTIRINRVSPSPPPVPRLSWPLSVDEDTIMPASEMMLAAGDTLEVSFSGAPGNIAEFQWAGRPWTRMTEETDPESTAPTGIYRATITVTETEDVTSDAVHFHLRAPERNARAADATEPAVIEFQSKGKAGVWGAGTVRLAVVKPEGASLAFGLHEVRLGGPYFAEPSSGTILRLTGQRGRNYRVRLAPGHEAWIPVEDVSPAPASTSVPHLYFTNISVQSDAKSDQVIIPYTARVPFSVNSTVAPGGHAAIDVDFYGAHNAATWISHMGNPRLVREVTAGQAGRDRLRVRVELNSGLLWGYRWETTTSSLRLEVRRPPVIAAPPESPLKGLVIALEPGHGGHGAGAAGVTGYPEKEINRLTAQELADQLTSAGARAVIVRPGDEDPTLGERVERAAAANADFFISIHANWASQDRGYLRISGMSTYYKHGFCRDLSAAIHKRLLEQTGLGDFGNVGAFNYYPIRRITWMPSMLVEQAFMSNPEDEARMRDPSFRSKIAAAIRMGIEDFLKEALFPAETGGKQRQPNG
ncbi:MAG: N-acetylmuramoyl-L-alanine amidase [Candidatus Sumerlaeota bacterium]|nr:N-acetylmuramoyl-L-alanine amidase [Candidatus Sumerlaeota bacterium]